MSDADNRETAENRLSDDYESWFGNESDTHGHGLPDTFDPNAGGTPTDAVQAIDAKIQAAADAIKEQLINGNLAQRFKTRWEDLKTKWTEWQNCMAEERTPANSRLQSHYKYTFGAGAWIIEASSASGIGDRIILDYGYWNGWPSPEQNQTRTHYSMLVGPSVWANGGDYNNHRHFDTRYGGDALFEYGKMPWANFSKNFSIHFKRMVSTMDNMVNVGALPEVDEIIALRNESIEAQTDFIAGIFKRNHDNDVDRYLSFGMAVINDNNSRHSVHPNNRALADTASAQDLDGCPAFELIADPFYDGVPSDLQKDSFLVSAYHPSIIFNGWLDTLEGSTYSNSTTDPGGGCGGPLQKIAQECRQGRWGKSFWMNRYGRNPDSEGFLNTGGGNRYGFNEYTPEWILKWNEWPSALDEITQYRNDLSYSDITTDSQNYNNIHYSYSLASLGSKYTLLGRTFYGGSFLQPEMMYWWNQRFDVFGGAQEEGSVNYTPDVLRHFTARMADDWEGYIYSTPNYPGEFEGREYEGSIGAHSVEWKKFYVNLGTYCVESTYANLDWMDDEIKSVNVMAWGPGNDGTGMPLHGAGTGWRGTLRSYKQDKNDSWDNHGYFIEARMGMRGEGAYGGDSTNRKFPGNGDLIGMSDWNELKECYFNLKDACIKLRKVSSEILKLDVALFVAEQEKLAILNYYLDPNIRDGIDPDEIEELERLLEELEEQMESDDYLTLTSDYTRSIIFKEQCFLLANIFPLSEWYKEQTKLFSVATGRGRLPVLNPPYWDNGAFGNSPLFVDGEPYSFFNTLTKNSSDGSYLNATEAEISGLQPLISLYKVEFNSEDRTESEVKIDFDSFANKDKLSDMLTNKKRRGFGVGIKSFDFTYAGSNPFSARRSIQAKLIIFANSFDELLMERDSTDPEGKKYRYVDLALKTRSASAADQCAGVSTNSIENENMAKLNFRLKAVVGWSNPPGYTSNMSSGFKTAIYDSFITLNLTPTVHSFDFDEMGRVTFEINYLAYVDDFLEQGLFSIFANTEITKNNTLRELTYREYRRNCAGDSISTMKDDIKDVVSEEKRTGVSSLLNGLIIDNRIYHINMTYEQMRNFSAEGPFLDPPPGADALTPRTDEQRLAALSANIDTALEQFLTRNDSEDDTMARQSMRASLTVNNPNQADVPFFFAGDLINNIMSRMSIFHDELKTWANSDEFDSDQDLGAGYKSDINACDKELKKEEIERCVEEYKKFRVVLGPMEIVNRTNDTESKIINLADLPISTKYFIEFLTEKLAQKELATYQLSSFLNDFFNSLLRNFLNNDTCFKTDTSQRISLTQAAVTSYKHGSNYDEITQAGYDAQVGEAAVAVPNRFDVVNMAALGQILNISGVRGQNDGGNLGYGNMINYMLFFAGRLGPPGGGTGNPNTDLDAGVYHFTLGRDKGIVKNITLQKTQTPGLQEVRFEQDGYDGLSQLRVVYDVEIECYSYVKAFPGTYIFVNPQSFAPSTSLVPCADDNLTRYGIGGYYMIIRSEHTFASGEATTKIIAKWVASVEGQDGECGDGGLINTRACSS